MKIIPKCIKTKRHLCASGSILLPLAQKWSLVGVVICGLSLVGAQSVSAASITLTVPTEKALSLSLTPTASGSFNKSDAANITIKTDALAGYTLSVKAKDGTDLKNKTNPSDTNIISSLGSTTVSENDFKNATNTKYNNKWGFAFGQGTVGTTFRGLTGSTGVEIGRASEPNDTINTYSIVLGARVDNTIATGTYSNTFIVEASANPVPYKVSYNPNASSDQVKNMPDSNSGQTDTEAFTITEKQPTREGYRFIGWCDGTTTKETDVDICSAGKSYQPSDPYTLKEKSQNVTLLAMWAKDSQIMQNWKGCDGLDYSTGANSAETILIDIRDNKLYYVAKLADGRCWMTENLDLDIVNGKEYTVADTDLAFASDEDKGASRDDQDNYVWKPSGSTHKTNDKSWVTTLANENGDTINGDKVGDTMQQSYDPGDYCWNGTFITTVPPVGQGEYFKQHTEICQRHQKNSDISEETLHHYLGNYYNYGAAVAQNDTSSKKNNLDKYSTSICPAGWQLPVAKANPGQTPNPISTIQELFQAASSAEGQKLGYGKATFGANGNTHQAPYYITYAGYWRGDLHDLGYTGSYVHDAINSAQVPLFTMFHANQGNINSVLVGSWYRFWGLSVRCVLREE